MGTSLINTKPQDTYPGLIKTTDNAAISATLKTLSDGNGNDLPMQISTTAVNFTGTLTQNGSPVTTPPSGVSGAIQFSNGSAFASDAANLFWDDTNNRLGIGTNSPASPLSIVNTIALSAGATNPRIGNIAYTINNSGAQTGTVTGIFLNATETALNSQTHNLLDLQVGGITKFKVQNNGYITGQNIILGSDSAWQIKITTDDGTNPGGTISYTNSGQVFYKQFMQGGNYNFVGNGFPLAFSSNNGTNKIILSSVGNLQFNGTSSSFPMIKRNGAAFDFRLADDSAFCAVNTGVLSIQNTVAAAVAVASTHKVTVVIGGTTYYLLASNV
jgi:hypothetical protein